MIINSKDVREALFKADAAVGPDVDDDTVLTLWAMALTAGNLQNALYDDDMTSLNHQVYQMAYTAIEHFVTKNRLMHAGSLARIVGVLQMMTIQTETDSIERDLHDLMRECEIDD